METRRPPAQAHPAAHAFTVSVKGVAVQEGKVLLLENERNEWELPGGKLELGEDPPDCMVREICEETGWKVTVGPLLDCWQYHIREGSDVVIVTYGCRVHRTDPPVVSNEHKRAGLFAPGQVPGLVMPDGYKRSITDWFARLNGGPSPPTPQWRVIERITTADVLARAGDDHTAASMLSAALSDAATLRLPHQIQRIIRLTGQPGVLAGHAIREHARAALTHLDVQLAATAVTNETGGHGPGQDLSAYLRSCQWWSGHRRYLAPGNRLQPEFAQRLEDRHCPLRDRSAPMK